MCGLLAVIGSKDYEKAQKMAKKLSHRGPDESGIHVTPYGMIICHERLSINDLSTGKQPIRGTREAQIIHNGEIYNHQLLRKNLKDYHTKRTTSDSEIILHLYEEVGVETVHLLDGVFAFVIVDRNHVFAARDPIGVKPLYYGYDTDGAMWLASESKALMDQCQRIEEFPPGHYYTRQEGFVRYFSPEWMGKEKGPTSSPTGDGRKLRQQFEAAIKKRLMSDVPLGVLLSGGLDSSLVASCVAREMQKQGKTVKSFSIGIKGDSTDLVAARAVAKFIGTEHHEVIYTLDQGLEMMNEVIHKIETFDVTTIRASIPMYILSKYIREQGVKVVLSGEGADEIFGGYLYFSNAPTSNEFHQETIRRVNRLYTSDVLRADRSTMGAGVEARVPFLDLNFLETAMDIDPRLKEILPNRRMEKNILRKAFDDENDPYLPQHILWRQKEQFSDGVGYSWIDGLKDFSNMIISDHEFSTRDDLYPYHTPQTKEAFLYRQIFSKLFPSDTITKLVHKWVPKWQTNSDPSGRANKNHVNTYHQTEESVILNDSLFAI